MEYAEGHIAVDGVQLRYIEAGDGPTLVWLHGAGGLYITAGTDLLTERFHIVALELPGFGSSAEHDTARSFDELSEQAAEAISALGLRRYLLHGTSFGAATALHLALNHPDRVERLVLEAPAAFRPLDWTPPDLDTVRRGLFRHPERARRAQIDPERALRERELVNRMSLTVDRDALAARLRDLHVPTLVIFGDADTLTPPELAEVYCYNAPDCTSVIIEDSAHLISSDQPKAYARAVAEFALDARTTA
jgi:pimeloyl-ACP methyl ester carboxylesterase